MTHYVIYKNEVHSATDLKWGPHMMAKAVIDGRSVEIPLHMCFDDLETARAGLDASQHASEWQEVMQHLKGL